MIAALDGCKTGWIASIASKWPVKRGDLRTEVYPNFRDALEVLKKCSIIVFDMPAGLSDPVRNIPWPRACDKKAKSLLGNAHPRVFFAPPRSVLQADFYETFNKLHINITGSGVSKQAWGIVPKILEVDAVLTPVLQEKVREYHPELVFYHLNKNRAVESKHKKGGLTARRILITKGIGEDDLKKAELWVKETPRVAIDDLYDSLIGLDLCQRIDSKRAKVIPAKPQKDAKGLRMEIWY